MAFAFDVALNEESTNREYNHEHPFLPYLPGPQYVGHQTDVLTASMQLQQEVLATQSSFPMFVALDDTEFMRYLDNDFQAPLHQQHLHTHTPAFGLPLGTQSVSAGGQAAVEHSDGGRFGDAYSGHGQYDGRQYRRDAALRGYGIHQPSMSDSGGTSERYQNPFLASGPLRNSDEISFDAEKLLWSDQIYNPSMDAPVREISAQRRCSVEASETPAKAEAEAFMHALKDRFADENFTIDAHCRLAAAWKERRISEHDYYVGFYRLMRQKQATDLLEWFVTLMPPHWQRVDLKYLNSQIERDMEEKRALSVEEQAAQQALISRSRSQRHTKKRPTQGFRAGDIEELEQDRAAMKTTDLGGAVENAMSSIGDSTRPSLIVKLPIKITRDQATAVLTHLDPTSDKEDTYTPPRAKKKRDKKAQNVQDAPKAKNPQRRGSSNGRLSASKIQHIGPIYPTRRAVLARPDKPYICSLCGEGFTHPCDVTIHHGQTRPSSGPGCWTRHGKPEGEAERWDRHGSCRVAYPDINYRKVTTGYVILDQASLDRIEAACELGRKFTRENGLGGGEMDCGDGENVDVDSSLDADAVSDDELPAKKPAVPKRVVAGAD